MSEPQDFRNLNLDLNTKAKFSLREIILKYLSYLPLFVFTLVVFLGAAFLYIRYKVPIYSASTKIMVIGNIAAQNNSQQDIILQGISGVRPINLENEMQLIRSVKLLQKVVLKGGFNIEYSKEGNIKVFDAYKGTPFIFSAVSVRDSSRAYTIKIKKLTAKGGELEDANKKNLAFKWRDTMEMGGIRFCLFPTGSYTNESNDPYTIRWLPIAAAASNFQNKLSVGSLSSKTSILTLGVVVENKTRGKDFLDLLVKEIINSDVELKKEASRNTIAFIDDRLALVAKDLGKVEIDFKDFRKNSRFQDVPNEFAYYQSRLTEGERLVEGWKIEIKVVELIEEYLKKDNKYKPIASNLGVEDLAFTSMISKYNDLVTRKESMDYSTLAANDLSKQIESDLKEVKQNILEASVNVKQAKLLKINNYLNRNKDDLQQLALLPDKELTLQDINRQRQIKEKLYLYLLQRREETAISSVSTSSNYQPMDEAVSSNTPIEPKVSQIKSFAIGLGIILPILLIYLLDMLNDKVTTRQDVTAKSSLPIVGEVSHVDNNEEIVVQNSRNVVAEQFRILRSNLQFIMPTNMVGKGATTFLVTSSVSGEGKSFVSLNLAAVLSLTGKKVALLEFDLRKLKSIKLSELSNSNLGITNFLIGQIDNPADVYVPIIQFPNLHVFNTGPIPPNPSELIISAKMEVLFTYLKANYDYIVIDSAPVGLVSDSFALGKFADAVLYIVRQRYTFKKQLEFINDLKRDGKLNNIALVINDINLAGRYGYYGYGYGYGYGYMYRYGLGYGYNKYIYGGRKQDPYFEQNKKGYFDDFGKRSWWQKLFGK